MNPKWYDKILAEKSIAIICLAAIAVVAVVKLDDPIAIVTGAIGAIGGFTANEALSK